MVWNNFLLSNSKLAHKFSLNICKFAPVRVSITNVFTWEHKIASLRMMTGGHNITVDDQLTPEKQHTSQIAHINVGNTLRLKMSPIFSPIHVLYYITRCIRKIPIFKYMNYIRKSPSTTSQRWLNNKTKAIIHHYRHVKTGNWRPEQRNDRSALYADNTISCRLFRRIYSATHNNNNNKPLSFSPCHLSIKNLALPTCNLPFTSCLDDHILFLREYNFLCRSLHIKLVSHDSTLTSTE